MESIGLSRVAKAIGCAVPGGHGIAVGGVSTDTRTIGRGELFVALRGENFDGHDFVPAAFARGAVAALVSDPACSACVTGPLLVVEDTVRGLQDLAAWYRGRFDLPIVAVTGTNGKTTTKDMAWAAISSELVTMRTEGNLNNHIGVPLTLFRLASEHRAAVVEIGMSHPGEIARLAGIVRPSVGVITNVAEAHLATMVDVDAVAAAKGELLDALPPGGVAVLNADDPRVMSHAGRTKARVVTFGLSRDADVRAEEIREGPDFVSFALAGHGHVELPVPGRHNVMNALAALTAATRLGVGLSSAIEGLARFEPSAMRMKVEKAGRWTILNDAYNSNPGSLAAGLATLVSVGNGSAPSADEHVVKAAVLGDMLELGQGSESAHREVGAKAQELGVDYLFLFGREVEALGEGAAHAGMQPERIRTFGDKAELARAVAEELAGPAVILVKGSRGMQMEEVVELLTQAAPIS